MFAYCGNNPLITNDPDGHFALCLVIAAVAVSALLLTGCSSTAEFTAEPYTSADMAAKAFSEQTYSSSEYIRFEYSTTIYSQTSNGVTTYGFTEPQPGGPHESYFCPTVPEGATLVAYAHTHPNSNYFSPEDKAVANKYSINAYVIGPNKEVQRYNSATSTVTNLEKVPLIPLTDDEKVRLVNEFRCAWEEHIKSGVDSCSSMAWPTP